MQHALSKISAGDKQFLDLEILHWDTTAFKCKSGKGYEFNVVTLYRRAMPISWGNSVEPSIDFIVVIIHPLLKIDGMPCHSACLAVRWLGISSLRKMEFAAGGLSILFFLFLIFFVFV